MRWSENEFPLIESKSKLNLNNETKEFKGLLEKKYHNDIINESKFKDDLIKIIDNLNKSLRNSKSWGDDFEPTYDLFKDIERNYIEEDKN